MANIDIPLAHQSGVQVEVQVIINQVINTIIIFEDKFNGHIR